MRTSVLRLHVHGVLADPSSATRTIPNRYSWPLMSATNPLPFRYRTDTTGSIVPSVLR